MSALSSGIARLSAIQLAPRPPALLREGSTYPKPQLEKKKRKKEKGNKRLHGLFHALVGKLSLKRNNKFPLVKVRGIFLTTAFAVSLLALYIYCQI